MRNHNLLQRGGSEAYNSFGLAEGTNSATIKTLAANGSGFADFSVNGLMYTKADTDNIAMTALAEQADLTTCLYLIQITAGLVVSLKKGNEELTADLVNDRVSVRWPEPDADNCAIGGFRMVLSGAAFTSGTTDLAASGTDTFYNFGGGMPVQGLLA